MLTSSPFQPKILSLGGGGVPGIGHMGVWAALEEAKLTDGITIIAGSSIGSLMALGAALNCRAREMIKKLLLRKIDLLKFPDSIFPELNPTYSGLERLKLIYHPISFLLKLPNAIMNAYKGLCKGEYIEKVCTDMIKQQIFVKYKQRFLKEIEKKVQTPDATFSIEILNQLKLMLEHNGELTFLKLHQLRLLVPDLYLKDLYITATDIGAYPYPKLAMFSYQTVPDMPIAKAVHCSMAVPVLYQPVIYNDTWYIDGGGVANLPYEYFLNSASTKKLPMLNVALTPNPMESTTRKRTMNYTRYYGRLFYLSLAAQETHRTEQDYQNILYLNLRDVSPFNFSISPKVQYEKLIFPAYAKTKAFLEKKNESKHDKTLTRNLRSS